MDRVDPETARIQGAAIHSVILDAEVGNISRDVFRASLYGLGFREPDLTATVNLHCRRPMSLRELTKIIIEKTRPVTVSPELRADISRAVGAANSLTSALLQIIDAADHAKRADVIGLIRQADNYIVAARNLLKLAEDVAGGVRTQGDQ